MVHCLLNLWAPKWTLDQSESLREFVLDGFSYAQSAVKINDKYDTHFTRNAAIGRAHRIGLSALIKMKQPAKKRHQPYKPRPKKNHADHHAKAPVRCEVLPENVSLIDVALDGCRWPSGEGPFMFCNLVQMEGFSYCEDHQRKAVRPRTLG